MSSAESAARLVQAVDDLLIAIPCTIFDPRTEADYSRLVSLHATVRGLAAALGLGQPPPLEDADLVVHELTAAGPMVPIRGSRFRAPRWWEQQLHSLRAAAEALKASGQDGATAGRHVKQPRRRCRLRIKGKTVFLDGKAINLDLPNQRRAAALCFLGHVLTAAPNWISGKQINEAERIKPHAGLSGYRWHEIRRSLPAALSNLIESRTGAGYRLSPAAAHNFV
jgi:hypothetical protein